MFRFSRRGQATLSFILLISGIIIEIAIAGSFITYFLSTSGLGDRLAERAITAAQAGIRDAQIQIARNKDFSKNATSTYVLSIGSDSATVQVFGNTTDPVNTVYTITSVGVASS
ncbi:MAG TPA: hypothetical protein VMT55_04395, partial [Candidatus Sulfotelmatobacter sp.]|nr:hypothetical protein [Candidatus Sulfotelmatobacter sp.]